MDFTNHPLNRNVNVNKNSNTNNVNVQQVRIIADKLARRLNDEHSLKFYYKVARYLDEPFIWRQLDIALEKRRPANYFTSVCKVYLPAD